MQFLQPPLNTRERLHQAHYSVHGIRQFLAATGEAYFEAQDQIGDEMHFLFHIS